MFFFYNSKNTLHRNMAWTVHYRKPDLTSQNKIYFLLKRKEKRKRLKSTMNSDKKEAFW